MPQLTNLTWTDALLLGMGVLLFMQLLYHLIIYNGVNRLYRKSRAGKITYTDEQPPISVILYHDGPVEYLKRCLPALLAQDYPAFEVIVVSDAKSSDSVDYLSLMEVEYPRLYHSFLPDVTRWLGRKKLALNLGVRASKNEWLVFTEPYCCPESDQWLKLMARNFTSQTEIVLGFSGYERGKGWTHRNVCFDNLFRSLRFLGMGILNLPYMGIGKNLAYRKELFLKHKGYAAHLDLLWGDDDLFVNEVANSCNTRVEVDPKATMRMERIINRKIWRSEHLGYESTSHHFRGMQRFLLGFETFSRILFFLSCMAALVWGILTCQWLLIVVSVGCLLLRFVSLSFIINKSVNTLGEKHHFYFTLPLFDIKQPFDSLYWKLAYLFADKRDFKRH